MQEEHRPHCHKVGRGNQSASGSDHEQPRTDEEEQEAVKKQFYEFREVQQQVSKDLGLKFDEFDAKLENLVGAESISGQFYEMKEILARVIEEERTALTREKKRIS